MALHIGRYGEVLRTLQWDVLRKSYFKVLRTSSNTHTQPHTSYWEPPFIWDLRIGKNWISDHKYFCVHFLLQSEPCNFIKKETLPQLFSCEFCKISKNTFTFRTPLVAASEHYIITSTCKNRLWKVNAQFFCYQSISLILENDRKSWIPFLFISESLNGNKKGKILGILLFELLLPVVTGWVFKQYLALQKIFENSQIVN